MSLAIGLQGEGLMSPQARPYKRFSPVMRR